MQKPAEIKRHFFETPSMVMLVAVAAMIFAVSPSFYLDGVLTSWDAVGHLLRGHYWARHFAAMRFLGGWFPHWNGGFDLYDTAPPLFTYLIGVQDWLFSPQLLLRWTMGLLWIGIVPVSYRLLRRFSVEPDAAAIGASMMLFLNNNTSFGIEAIYGMGLLPNALGFLLSLLYISQLKVDLGDARRSYGQCLVSGLLFGSTVLAHPIAAYWISLVSLIFIFTEMAANPRRCGDVLRRSAFIFGIGGALSISWWLPLLMNFNGMYRFDPFDKGNPNDILHRFLLLDINGGLFLLPFVAFGLYYVCSREKKMDAVQWTLLMFLAAALSSNWINAVLPFGSVMMSTQRMRFEGYFIWCMLGSIAFAADFALRTLRGNFQMKNVRWIWNSAMVAFFLLMVFPQAFQYWNRVYVIRNPVVVEIAQVNEFLKKNLVVGDFVLGESSFPSGYYGTPHFLTQYIPFEVENFWDLGGNFPEGSLSSITPFSIARNLARLGRPQTEYLLGRGVRYIIATQKQTAEKLNEIDALENVWPERKNTIPWKWDRLSIYEFKGFNRRFGLPVQASDRLARVTFEPRGVYRLDFSRPVTLPEWTPFAVSYHPWIQLRADGVPVKSANGPGYLLHSVEGLKNVSEIEIEFNPHFLVRFAQLVSLLTWLSAGFFLVRPRQ